MAGGATIRRMRQFTAFPVAAPRSYTRFMPSSTPIAATRPGGVQEGVDDRATRFRISLPVEFRHGSSGQALHGVTLDISRTGLRMETDATGLRPGDLLCFAVKFPATAWGKGAVAACCGRVRRVGPPAAGGWRVVAATIDRYRLQPSSPSRTTARVAPASATHLHLVASASTH